MIRHMTAEELRAIARAGASFSMDPRTFELEEVRAILRALTPGATVTLYHTRYLTVPELTQLARAAPGQVVFEMDGPPTS